MSAAVATQPIQATRTETTVSRRDLRLDYMRGIALLMIFVDHVSGNRFAALTLQSIGFADAAEVFVFIAGLAGVYAYRKTFLNSGFAAGSLAVLRRIRRLYLAHLGMVLGILAFAAVAVAAGTGFDIVLKLGLQPLLDDPVQAALRIPVLGYLPHYLDILPLYVVLLATLPFIIMGFRLHTLLPLGVAAAVHMMASATGTNAPDFGMSQGWFINPLSWALLFTAGATIAELAARGAFRRLPKALIVAGTVASAAYVGFAFLHEAPWRVFPALEPFAAFGFVLTTDKAYLSWHRLLDILAKVWLVAVLIPPTASFMRSGLGGAISRAGRNSLPIFIAGTFLSMLGSVILFESAGHALAHIGVTFGGVASLLALAWAIERRDELRAVRTAAAFQPVTVTVR
jgi:hypothetical protein